MAFGRNDLYPDDRKSLYHNNKKTFYQKGNDTPKSSVQSPFATLVVSSSQINLLLCFSRSNQMLLEKGQDTLPRILSCFSIIAGTLVIKKRMLRTGIYF